MLDPKLGRSLEGDLGRSREDITGGVGSDPRIGNMLVQGCTNGGLRIEAQSGNRVDSTEGLEIGDWS